MTFRARVLNYVGALLLLSGIRPAFLSVYIQDPDFESKTNSRRTEMSHPRSKIILKRIAIRHDVRLYVQCFASLRGWATSTVHSGNFRLLIHEDRRTSIECISRYNLPSTFEVATIIPGVGDGIFKRTETVLHRCGFLNSTANEMFDAAPYMHRSYDPRSYVILLSFG